MSEDLNSVIIVGRLTRDAELQYTNTGWAIAKMGMAVNRRRKQGDQWVDEANFFDVTLFGKRAESLNQYLVKGTQLAVEGQLRQERWEQDGMKRSKVTIEATNIQLLGSKSSDNQGQQGGASSQNATQNSSPQKERFEENIPF